MPPPPTGSAATRAGTAKKLEVARAGSRAAGLPLTVNAVVHRQNLDQLEAMIELAVELRRAPARGGAHPVLRLGAAQPGGADAEPGADRARQRGGRARRGRGCKGRLVDRLRGARLLCAPAQALHGRLGPADAGGDARGRGHALPRRGRHPRARVRQCAPAPAALDLARNRRPSSAFAAPTGCPSPAAPASGARSISAAAAARPWR